MSEPIDDVRTADPREVGVDPERLERLAAAVEDDVAAARYDGAVIAVARGGRVVFHRALGFAERASGRRARHDDVFCLFSVTKTLTAATVLARVDRGALSLTTPIAEVIPEFGVKGKQRVTVAHLLTHSGGLPFAYPVGFAPEQVGDLAATVAATCGQAIELVPGGGVNYSALVAHAVLAEAVRRVDGGRRRFRDILAVDVLEPLGMRDTWLGLRPDLAPRRVPVVVRDRSPGLFDPDLLEAFNALLTEEAEMPAAGAISTAADLLRFAEALRRGGALGAARILSPAILRLATTNQTGTRPNALWSYAREMRGWDEFPAFIGLSFFLRGTGLFPTPFGHTASPGTFGGIGAGSTLFWVDPERALSFVCLTAGLLEESRSVERFQRLSDLALAAVVG
jgi:CubicO group peptidase (beta-lactamase class C family)